MSRASLTCYICSMAQLPLTRTSEAGTYAMSIFLLACSLTPANHQELLWNPTLTDHVLIALVAPPLAPESTYRAKTIAPQSRRTYWTRTHRTRSKGGKGRDRRDRDRDRDRSFYFPNYLATIIMNERGFGCRGAESVPPLSKDGSRSRDRGPNPWGLGGKRGI
jgi:hypothetical protein